jgi:hypothetical protein
MRSYPRNSPQAAARIVAMTMLADGNLCKAELDALQRHRADHRLGLGPAELRAIVQEMCEDLLRHSQLAWTSTSAIEPHTLREIMAEVDDPVLRAVVLQLCVAVVAADEHLAAGESTMMDRFAEHWRSGGAFMPAPPQRACPPGE